METYDFRCIHRFIKIAVNRLTNHRAKFLHISALSMDAIAKSAGVEPAIHLVFAYFKNNFAHGKSLVWLARISKSDC